MKPELVIGKYTYSFKHDLGGGYYNANAGWHHYMSGKNYVYNIDENGIPFFNKIN